MDKSGRSPTQNNSQDSSQPLVLETINLIKCFHEVVANDEVCFELRKGEIHCLLGENGAGKSTLAECLYGYYKPDGGEIRKAGETVDISSPNDAMKLGIGMVHQHFDLIEPLTVVENIVIGTKIRGIFLNLSIAEKQIKQLCDQYGVDINLKAKIWQLSVGQQQWVEILKALYIGCEVLILDEPTATLTPQESERLFNVLQQMKKSGLSIIFITHKLKEVMEVSDRVTVLRRGKLIATVDTKDVTKEDLVSMMVGRKVMLVTDKEDMPMGKPILQVTNLAAKNDIGQKALHEISFDLHQNEILGVAGVAGNGQRELFETLIGVRKAEEGQILLDQDDITNCRPRRIQNLGINHVPDDRLKMGLVPEFSVAENLILGNQNEKPFRKGITLDEGYIDHFAHDCVDDYGILTPSIDQMTENLSGGNQQKVIMARELHKDPRVLIANQPSRGLDVGVIEYVHKKLVEKRGSGAGILLFSEDLDEIMSLSDRIIVLFKGKIMGLFSIKEASVEEIGLLMAGIESETI